MRLTDLLRAAVLAAGLTTGAAAQAGDAPVVVELYTSQGCSSCPPADALLSELAGREGVIALALHVDYWDYIGWKDSFARPAFTARQKGYAEAAGRRSIYTPQMIIDGTHDVVGNRAKDVTALIAREEGQGTPVDLTLDRQGDRLSIALSADAPVGPLELHLVRYRPKAQVAIARGENAGHKLSYSHIVTDWDVVARWDGEGEFEADVLVSGDSPIVVLAQTPGYGPIVTAAELR
ncbi:DUF1223 domain-containing protein [Roseivivax sp. GX 12232]|uniref:DUF1223 domain-containing protein n=1 Tax=Roseivivax sp. GX 12232 TaxID=2900547 RepID=UPI001E3DBC9A|nr:DUF1223 domain-containing protein [Roseivivax sp. GX 12232]MCE0504557.1 DUF1223 domain-containing protein [Roseivivax sp. GX 12232]